MNWKRVFPEACGGPIIKTLILKGRVGVFARIFYQAVCRNYRCAAFVQSPRSSSSMGLRPDKNIEY